MKSPHHQKFQPVTAMLLLVVLAACGIYPGTSVGQLPSPLPTPTITPTPLGFVESTSTPTPSATWDVTFNPDIVTPEPTWTPTITPVVINMAETLPQVFTYRFEIERADGRHEVYYVPLGVVPMVRTESDWAIYEDYVQSQFDLGPGDVLVSGCALAPWMLVVSPQMVCSSSLVGPGLKSDMQTPTPSP